MERVWFDNKCGERLSGIIHGSIAPQMAILCHGMMSTKDGTKHVFLAEELARHHVASLRFDFAGRGESGGSTFDMTYSKQQDDLEAAINYLVAQGTREFALFGSSMGGAVALLTAARDERITAVATLAAVGHPADIADRYPKQIHAWRSQGYLDIDGSRIGIGFVDDALQHDVVASAGVLRSDLLVIHGERDEVVPVSDAHDIAAAAQNVQLDIVAEADHRFSEPTLMREVMRQVAQFIVKKLRGDVRAEG